MSELRKAELVEIGAGNNPQPVGTPDVVQFNPTSLRVQISNRSAGGQQAGAQGRQSPGNGEVTVSFELVFDTADEGGDVLRKTSIVDRYVRPRGNQAGHEAPPRVQFTWGTFQVQGVMDSANTDIDLFDADGTPLRAKVSVSIKGQDPRWAYHPSPRPQVGPGTSPSGQAVNASALPVGQPGTSGSTASAVSRVAQAMPGEGLAQLASRMGVAADAWRALADGVGDPLSLKLGQEVTIPASLSGGAASGSRSQGSDPARSTANLDLVGNTAGAGTSAARSDVTTAPSANALRRAPQQTGLSLTARGGVGSAIDQTHAERHQTRAVASLAAFGMAAAGTGDSSDRPWGAGVPLRPRLGCGAPVSRRDPTQPGWLADSLTTANATNSTTTVIAASARKPGCGCKNKK